VENSYRKGFLRYVEESFKGIEIMAEKKSDDIDKRIKELEKTVTNEEIILKQKNRTYHDRQSERQISWERSGSKDENRDRT